MLFTKHYCVYLIGILFLFSSMEIKAEKKSNKPKHSKEASDSIEVTAGSVITLNLRELGIVSSEEKKIPSNLKFYVTFESELLRNGISTVKLRKLKIIDDTYIDLFFKKGIPLIDKEKYREITENSGEYLNKKPIDPLLSSPLMIKSEKQNELQQINLKLKLVPPKINDLRFDKIASNSGGKETVAVVEGKFFRRKPKNIWVEFMQNGILKKKKCRIVRPLEYPDHKGKKHNSCMDIKTGESFLKVRIPWKIVINRDVDSKLCLVIDNRVGIDAAYFNLDNPDLNDVDCDGMPDKWEIEHFGNLKQNAEDDFDRDSLNNLNEYKQGTDPKNPDSDGDSVTDGSEVNKYKTNPLKSDTDSDGIPDGWEIKYSLNPLLDDSQKDPDGDELTNIQEYEQNTNPLVHNFDSDRDGLLDSWELEYFGKLKYSGNDDPDKDSLSNMEEFNLKTNPALSDTDNDGLKDGEEINTYHTDPLNPDTDGDGFSDGREIFQETDPKDKNKFPVQVLLLTRKKIDIEEGKSVVTEISLSIKPLTNLEVNISYYSGDRKIVIADKKKIVFTPKKWQEPRKIEFFCPEDDNCLCATAKFMVSVPGYGEGIIFVQEIEKHLQIELKTNGSGKITPSGTIQLTKGSEIKIEAFPDPGFIFDKWSGNVPEEKQKLNPLIINVDASCRITANFIRNNAEIYSGRTCLEINSVISDWCYINHNNNGGFKSDISFYNSTSKGNVLVDNLEIVKSSNPVFTDNFEHIINQIPPGWNTLTNNSSLININADPDLDENRILKIAGDESVIQAIYRPGTSSEEDVSVAVDLYLPAGLDPEQETSSIWFNGIHVIFTSQGNDKFSAFIGNADSADKMKLCHENLGSSQWYSLILHYNKMVDSDQDGLDDEWEKQNIGDLSQNGNDDHDRNGTNNANDFMSNQDIRKNTPEIFFKKNNSIISESNGKVEFELSLSRSVSKEVSVAIKVNQKSTAENNADFIFQQPFFAKFAPGETQQKISFDIVQDDIKEQQEKIILDLVNPRRVEIGKFNQHIIYINNSEPPQPDNDNDGLPDPWEIKYFGNLDQGPKDDPDEDKADNLTEYKQGRHPNAGYCLDTENKLKLKVFIPTR